MMLPHRIVIERAARSTDDERGVPAQTWGTLVDEVPAFVQPLTSREMHDMSQGGPVVSDHAIYLLPTDIEASDRIRFKDRIYQVDDRPTDEAEMGHHLKVLAHLVEDA